MEEAQFELKRRKRFSIYQKRLILKEHAEQGISVALLSRKYQIHPVTISQWKRSIDLSNEPKEPQVSTDNLLSEIERLENENRRLKSVVGELTLDKACQGELIEAFKKKLRNKLSVKLQPVSSQGGLQSSGPVGCLEDLANGTTRTKNERSGR